jgi:hypothetical protein
MFEVGVVVAVVVTGAVVVESVVLSVVDVLLLQATIESARAPSKEVESVRANIIVVFFKNE